AGNSLPEEVSFDVVAILMDLGEFEKADDIVQQYQQLFTIDEYTQRLMRDRVSRSEQRRTQFRQMHERGIQEYEDRRYKEALNSFREALKMAPLNSGAALNFIQAAVRYCAEANSDNEIGFLKKECLSCLRTLQGMTLTASHAARYEQLIKQTARFNLS
ncbi:MAG: response regulator, partial [Pseudomonadota bacterium]|nr:response regulator [Pseudomonadota bacterium]